MRRDAGEALIEDPAVIEDTGGQKVTFYRLFTKIWNSVGINSETQELDPDMPADTRLASLTPKPRQAFLLVALEGFFGRRCRIGARCRCDDTAGADRGIRPGARR